MVAVGYADRSLVIIDPLTMRRLAGPVQLPETATALAFSASGDLAACYGIDVAVFPKDLSTCALSQDKCFSSHPSRRTLP